MTNIKFRAWCKLDKVMLPWERIKSEFTFEYFEDEGLEFMQYTGLKDVNGVEIYEGDILWDEHYELHGVVKFDEGKFIYSWDNIDIDLFEVHTTLPIIGNIHENPELMEG